jgi:phosphoadenosine phosphosulfate reductase
VAVEGDAIAVAARGCLHTVSARRFAELRSAYSECDDLSLLRGLRDEPELAGRMAVVSAFGAESVVLLDLVASIDRAWPVLFLDTGKHFPERLAYRGRLVALLRLTDVRTLRPTPASLEAQDPDGELWRRSPDACCRLRKIGPLSAALEPFVAW